MPELTIGRMAKLYGLHRSTLYEAIERGRVTAGFNGKGQRVVELSEMIRRYGEPPHQPEGVRQNPTAFPDTRPTPGQTVDNVALLARFDALLEVVKEQRDELKALREEVHQLRRLPAPSHGSNTPSRSGPSAASEPSAASSEAPMQESKERDVTSPRSFADIADRFAERIGKD